MEVKAQSLFNPKSQAPFDFSASELFHGEGWDRQEVEGGPSNEARHQREIKLWSKVSSLQLDDPSATLPFSQRLMKNTGWNSTFALEAISEYKKFLYLLARGDQVAPPPVIDAVWQHHLQYTREYWQEFCAKTLRMELHRDPERVHCSKLLARTLQLYADCFKSIPPTHIWSAPLKISTYAETENDCPSPRNIARLQGKLCQGSEKEITLWKKIVSFDFEGLHKSEPFIQKLAEHLNCPTSYALGVLREYRRFLFLGVVESSVTPSKSIDEAWHLHLADTVGYWKNLCENVLGIPFHHSPGNGNPVSEAGFQRQFFKTLDAYISWFGENPPKEFWGDYKINFEPDPAEAKFA